MLIPFTLVNSAKPLERKPDPPRWNGSQPRPAETEPARRRSRLRRRLAPLLATARRSRLRRREPEGRVMASEGAALNAGEVQAGRGWLEWKRGGSGWSVSGLADCHQKTPPIN